MTAIQKLLKRCGAELERHNKHQVWRLPDGRNFVMAATASDHRAEKNQIRDLRRMLRVKGGEDGTR
jgi:hypothetical protein